MIPSKVKVLIIEDDQEDYLITQDILSQIENIIYEVDWEQDYDNVMSRIAEQAHDVYLIDYNLGPYSGIEIVKNCISRGINVPFVFLTGMNNVNVDIEAMSAGAADYLIKNDLTPQLLERSIRYAIRQKATEVALLNANATKDKLFSIISHDLRAPIGTFMNTTELLTEDRSIGDDLKQNVLKELARTSKSIFNLLENLLFWSRGQLGSISYNPVIIDVKSLVDEVLELFENQAHTKKIQLKNSIDSIEKAYVDQNHLKLILRNLISNALKFTHVSGSIEISTETQGEMLQISVKDNGVGMDEATCQKLFNPNVFKTTFGTNNEAGSGLGLKIVNEFISKCGGELKVASEPGKGSNFSFTIPILE